ncbi:hypothetical protein [Aeromonas veronii]|uniref:hypothetical protein n=1 Tax=Aeromonas veronii TaxID=654 RepID=UPI000946D284|nr:hypothetical protein [Aeromonas veronii]MCF5763805.1 hypothetical protein [Aeromonas veronii]OLF59046.1 hypothetical protein BTN33_11110 [Aeromonas veronii]
MDDVIETLKSFNAKIERLERSGFAKRFEHEVPEVIAKFASPVNFENHGDGCFTLGGKIESWVPDYNEDEIDAVVLTYRILTQNNDRVSLASLARIYNSDWFPEEGTQYFNEARDRVNEYLDSPATVRFEAGWITIRSLMEIIIYGGLAHTNLKKERIFNSWVSSGASGFFKVEFIAALRFMISYFKYFKELNEVTLKVIDYNKQLNSSSDTIVPPPVN